MILIRADASTQMGTGHIMRCLALAQEYRQSLNQTAIFAIATCPPELKRRLRAEGMTIMELDIAPGSEEDSRETAALAQKLGAKWVILDGYHFGADYQRQIKQAGLFLLVLDDYVHADRYWADLVLNQNINAEAEWYQNCKDYTQLLLGTEYCLLRQEFQPWRNWKREIPPIARRILVTLGGSDPDNVTLSALRALAALNSPGLESVIVAGGGNPHYNELQAALAPGMRLERNVEEMPELMAWADMAIAAGGSTNWELAFMGLPSILISIADNQVAIAKRLGELGVGIYLGRRREATMERIEQAAEQLIGASLERRRMSQKGRELVDGQGAGRVVSKMIGMLS